MDDNKIKAYVLNDFLRFERKLYSIFGYNLGRSIQFKTLLYFGGTLIVFVILSLLPIIGTIIKALPLLLPVIIAGLVAYLLTDVGTENRAPLRFFQSFLRYHWISLRNETYYKGKILTKPKPLEIKSGITVSEPVEVDAEEKQPVQFEGDITYR